MCLPQHAAAHSIAADQSHRGTAEQAKLLLDAAEASLVVLLLLRHLPVVARLLHRLQLPLEGGLALIV